jgi:hypothetical protein
LTTAVTLLFLLEISFCYFGVYGVSFFNRFLGLSVFFSNTTFYYFSLASEDEDEDDLSDDVSLEDEFSFF